MTNAKKTTKKPVSKIDKDFEQEMFENKSNFSKGLKVILFSVFAFVLTIYFPLNYVLPTMHDDPEIISNVTAHVNIQEAFQYAFIAFMSVWVLFNIYTVISKKGDLDKKLIIKLQVTSLFMTFLSVSLAVTIPLFVQTFVALFTHGGLTAAYYSFYIIFFVVSIAGGALIWKWVSKIQPVNLHRAWVSFRNIFMLGIAAMIALMMLGLFGIGIWGMALYVDQLTFTVTPGSGFPTFELPSMAVTNNGVSLAAGKGLGGTAPGNWQAFMLFAAWGTILLLLSTISLFYYQGKFKISPKGYKLDNLSIATFTLITSTLTLFGLDQLIFGHLFGIHNEDAIHLLGSYTIDNPTGDGDNIAIVSGTVGFKGDIAYYATFFTMTLAIVAFPLHLITNEIIHSLKSKQV